jgi:hypothetical protein
VYSLCAITPFFSQLFPNRAAPRKRTPEEDKEALDLEMDLLAAERDGGDVESVKAAHRKKREEREKSALDGDMDHYFLEKDGPAPDAAAEAANDGVAAADAPAVARTMGTPTDPAAPVSA